ncbi:MAG: hypothetical protein A2428_14595 [Bdellovibrionales bacterium RIFOXYC1_FULL_54_43]|nr:MAG: hypothetical protein A2428_14595 [Bdellovibrionales bacterium RIFOXYC1_FULL_54_43]OFZ78955.1 MAG: hypothetical protein A2603_08670 [Bdellovibrionales bacterium RIFOXYD1_FULL_55_31]
MNALNQAFPDLFHFYHLGTVESLTEDPPVEVSPGESGFLFRLQGDFNFNLFVSFQPEPNASQLSACAEMGNVLASRIADQLNRANGDSLGFMVSPPQWMTGGRLEQIIVHSKMIARRTYLHRNRDGVIQFQIQTSIFGAPPENLKHV